MKRERLGLYLACMALLCGVAAIALLVIDLISATELTVPLYVTCAVGLLCMAVLRATFRPTPDRASSLLVRCFRRSLTLLAWLVLVPGVLALSLIDKSGVSEQTRSIIGLGAVGIALVILVYVVLDERAQVRANAARGKSELPGAPEP